MEKINAVAALAALAQDNRLDVFRLLVRAGPQGMSAGAVAETLLDYLTENCCQGPPCAPAKRRTSKSRQKERVA